MSSVWERFDEIAKPEDVEEVKASFKPVDEGTYTMRLEQLEPSESRSGLPMLKGRFRMAHNNRIVFYNQLLQNVNNPEFNKYNIGQAVAFLEGLIGDDIDYTGLSDLAEIVEKIPMGGEYKVKVTYGKKDFDRKFPQLEILPDDDWVENGEEDEEF